jgi:hypothetical protein
LKSKGFGGQASAKARRERQAKRVAEIYQDLINEDEQYVAVIVAFNDFLAPTRPAARANRPEDISSHARV